MLTKNIIRFINGSYIEAVSAQNAARGNRAGEPYLVYEISNDDGQSWSKQWLTPSDLVAFLCQGLLVRECLISEE